MLRHTRGADGWRRQMVLEVDTGAMGSGPGARQAKAVLGGRSNGSIMRHWEALGGGYVGHVQYSRVPKCIELRILKYSFEGLIACGASL